MTKKLSFATILLLGAFLLLMWQPPALAAPFAQSSTPTPTPAEEAPAAAEETEPTLQDLLARVDALQARIAELEEQMATAHSTSADANQMTTAVYLLDTAGLHDLDVRLNEEEVIEPSDAGRVARVTRLLSSVDWPEALAADATALIDLLGQLVTALTEDDLAAAAPLATQVHETQHDFSHAVEHWLGEAATTHESAGQAFRVTSAVYLLDTAGLHDLDVRLNEEGVIEPSDAGRVARVARLLSSVDWPEPLVTKAMTLTNVLTELTTALTDDDLETAAPLATLAHDVQHDFSHAAEHWLGEAMGAHGEEEEGEEEMNGAGDDHAAEETEGEQDDDHSAGG